MDTQKCPKRRHRFLLTERIILEEIFKNSSHPSALEIDQLAQRFNTDTTRIKTWFSNKRTQMKKRLKIYVNL